MRELRYRRAATKPMQVPNPLESDMEAAIEGCLEDDATPEYQKAAVRDLLEKADALKEKS